MKSKLLLILALERFDQLFEEAISTMEEEFGEDITEEIAQSTCAWSAKFAIAGQISQEDFLDYMAQVYDSINFPHLDKTLN